MLVLKKNLQNAAIGFAAILSDGATRIVVSSVQAIMDVDILGFVKRSRPYALVASVSLYLRWIVLKSVAVLLYIVCGRTERVERTVIRIGNSMFGPQVDVAVAESFDAYVKNYAATFAPYEMLAKENGLTFAGIVVDAGSGLGQYVTPLLEQGAERVLALEVQDEKVSFLKKRFESNSAVSVVECSLQKIPLEDASVDLIFSHTVFEHLQPFDACMAELHRILKPNGVILAGFNYFHNSGGSHLVHFINFPWPTWVISEKTLCNYWTDQLSALQSRGGGRFFAQGTVLTSLESTAEFSLNKLRFRDAEKVFAGLGLQIEAKRYSDPIAALFPSLLKMPNLAPFVTGPIFYCLRKVTE